MKTETKADKPTLCSMIRATISQRSGIERRNYQRDCQDTAGAAAFMADYREILRDGRDARRLLKWIENRDGITAADIQAARNGNGRLEFATDDSGRLRLDYCTGQYFPTEYRATACSMLAGIIWRYIATDYPTDGAGEIRKAARRIFGRGIASRWFA